MVSVADRPVTTASVARYAMTLVHTAPMDGPSDRPDQPTTEPAPAVPVAPAVPAAPAPPVAPAAPGTPAGPPAAVDGGGMHIGPWPFGIVAVAALRLFDAVGLILVGLDRPGLPIGSLPVIGSSTPITRGVDLVAGILVLVGIIGLLLFKRWGWVLTMLLVGMSLVGDLIRVAIGDPAYFGLLLHVLAAFYLNARSVRALAHEDIDREPVLRP